jgi:hypothetical protein
MKKQTEETKLKKQIKDYLKIYGFKIIHNLQGLGCYPGLSDWMIPYNGHVRFIEIKTPKGKQSQKQKDFQELIESCNCYYYIWSELQDAIDFVELVRQHKA